MNYAPVPSTASGAIDLPERPDVRVTLADPPTDGFAADGITLNASLVSGSLLTSLGFQLTMQGSYTYYLLDFAATQHVASPDQDDPSEWSVLGVGLRLGFSGLNVSGKASFNLGGLAASASLNATQSSFQTQTLGIGLDMNSLTFVQALIKASLGPFNLTSIQLVGSAFGQFTDYMTKGSASLTAQPIGVVLDNAQQLQSVATSYGYALRAIQDGQTLSGALSSGVNELPDGVQRLDPVLAATYATVLQETDPNTSPTDDDKTTADKLDNCGP